MLRYAASDAASSPYRSPNTTGRSPPLPAQPGGWSRERRSAGATGGEGRTRTWATATCVCCCCWRSCCWSSWRQCWEASGVMEAEEQGLLGLSSCWELAGWREQFSASWAQRNGQGERIDRLGLGFGSWFPTALTPAQQSGPRSPGTEGLLRGAALGSASGAARLHRPQDSTFRSDSCSQRAGRAAAPASGRSSKRGGQVPGEEMAGGDPNTPPPSPRGSLLPGAFASGSSSSVPGPSAFLKSCRGPSPRRCSA